MRPPTNFENCQMRKFQSITLKVQVRLANASIHKYILTCYTADPRCAWAKKSRSSTISQSGATPDSETINIDDNGDSGSNENKTTEVEDNTDVEMDVAEVKRSKGGGSREKAAVKLFFDKCQNGSRECRLCQCVQRLSSIFLVLKLN